MFRMLAAALILVPVVGGNANEFAPEHAAHATRGRVPDTIIFTHGCASRRTRSVGHRPRLHRRRRPPRELDRTAAAAGWGLGAEEGVEEMALTVFMGTPSRLLHRLPRLDAHLSCACGECSPTSVAVFCREYSSEPRLACGLCIVVHAGGDALCGGAEVPWWLTGREAHGITGLHTGRAYAVDAPLSSNDLLWHREADSSRRHQVFHVSGFDSGQLESRREDAEEDEEYEQEPKVEESEEEEALATFREEDGHPGYIMRFGFAWGEHARRHDGQDGAREYGFEVRINEEENLLRQKGGCKEDRAKGSQEREETPCGTEEGKGYERSQSSRRSRSSVACRLCGNVDGPGRRGGRPRGGRRSGFSLLFKLCGNVDLPQRAYEVVGNGTNGEDDEEGCRRCLSSALNNVVRANAGHPQDHVECGEKDDRFGEEDGRGWMDDGCRKGGWGGWRTVKGNRALDAGSRRHGLHSASHAHGTRSMPTHGGIGENLHLTVRGTHYTVCCTPHAWLNHVMSTCCMDGDGALSEQMGTKPLHQPRSWTSAPDDSVGRGQEDLTADEPGPRDPAGKAGRCEGYVGGDDGAAPDDGPHGNGISSGDVLGGDEGDEEVRRGGRMGGIAPLRRAAPGRRRKARRGWASGASWPGLGILFGAYVITVGIPIGLAYADHDEPEGMALRGGTGCEAGGVKRRCRKTQGGGSGRRRRRCSPRCRDGRDEIAIEECQVGREAARCAPKRTMACRRVGGRRHVMHRRRTRRWSKGGGGRRGAGMSGACKPRFAGTKTCAASRRRRANSGEWQRDLRIGEPGATRYGEASHPGPQPSQEDLPLRQRPPDEDLVYPEAHRDGFRAIRTVGFDDLRGDDGKAAQQFALVMETANTTG